MPSSDIEVHSAVVRSAKSIDPSLFGQYTGAETVIYKKDDAGYTYILRSETPRTYNDIEASINALDAHLIETNKENSSSQQQQPPESYFMRVVDDSKTSSGKIMLSNTTYLASMMSSKTGQFRKGVEVWRQTSTVPPRKRVTADGVGGEDSMLLIPGLKRLSKQLHVDFAINVHGTDGKRKRQPTRSIYEEAAMQEKKKAKRPYVRKAAVVVKKRSESSSKESGGDTSAAEISEIDESEFRKEEEEEKDTVVEEEVKKEYAPTMLMGTMEQVVSLATHMHVLDAKEHVIKTQDYLIKCLNAQIAGFEKRFGV